MKRRPKLNKWDAVWISWEDIVGSDGAWCEEDDDNTEVVTCQTRGFIYAGWSRKAKRLKICSTVTEGTISHRDAIPWGCVVGIVVEARKAKGEWLWERVDNA